MRQRTNAGGPRAAVMAAACALLGSLAVAGPAQGQAVAADAAVLAAELDNIGIAARDLSVMHAFYTRVLGMQAPPLADGATQFNGQLGGMRFLVFQTTSATDHGRSVPNFRGNPPGLDHLVFVVPDIQAATTWLERQGVVIEASGEQQGAWGPRQFRRFRDPEGNLLGIVQDIAR